MSTLEPELRQVLFGLSLNRIPGWNFPGNFLDLSFDEVSLAACRTALAPGPHCTDATGAIHLAAITFLADVTLACAMRGHMEIAGRIATVTMAMHFTGKPAVGLLRGTGRLEGRVEGVEVPQGIVHAQLHAADALIATASGTFVSLGERAGLAPFPERRHADPLPVPLLEPEDLEEDERRVWSSASRALEKGAPSFIENFWGLLPQRDEDGASCVLENGPQVGNRVGHTQGGITFALAALTACEALGEGWRLVSVSASYVRPGTGQALSARALTVHHGSLSAVVRTEVRDDEGRLVLDVVSQHARAQGAAAAPRP